MAPRLYQVIWKHGLALYENPEASGRDQATLQFGEVFVDTGKRAFPDYQTEVAQVLTARHGLMWIAAVMLRKTCVYAREVA